LSLAEKTSKLGVALRRALEGQRLFSPGWKPGNAAPTTRALEGRNTVLRDETEYGKAVNAIGYDGVVYAL
jgi:hypothetical protein